MAEEEVKTAGPIRMVAIDKMVEQIRYKGQILARTNKTESGVMDSGIIGICNRNGHCPGPDRGAGISCGVKKMAEKKSPASGWPIAKGDFHSGDANSPVAVVTMGSHLDEQGICDGGAALCGSCKTENLGLEKVIANIISNPNIRFVLLCGTEVKGHLSGQTLVALHKGGVKEGRVVGAEGAIPFIENLKRCRYQALPGAGRIRQYHGV